MSAPLRAAIYCRVSTTDQDCAMQLNDLRRYIEIRSWANAGEFVDGGISGATRSRPKLDELMTAVKKGQFDVVLVWRFDRMARSTTHLIEVLDTLRAHGVDFCSTQEQIETTSATGRLMFQIIAAFAEFERILIKERSAAGRVVARQKGVIFGRKPKWQNIPLAAIEAAVETAGSLRKAAPVLGMPLTTLRARWKEIIGARALALKSEEVKTEEEPKEVVCSS